MSEKLQLSSVSSVCVACDMVEHTEAVLEHVWSMVDFAENVFLTSEDSRLPHQKIKQIGHGDRVVGLAEYSEFMLRGLAPYIHTTHFLTIQHDGWILDVSKWDDSWLQYDYIGPLFIQYPLVGSGGFSLRSKRLHDRLAEIVQPLPWPLQPGRGFNGTGFVWEDGVICFGLRKQLLAEEFTYAPPEVAARFAYGGNATHYCAEPFGFHGFYALDTLLGGTGEPRARNPQFQYLE